MKLLIYLLIVSVGCCSCYHVYYAPNTANAPLLSKKGETRVNGLYASGGNSEFNGGELQIAHAVSKNFALMLNGFTAGKKEQVTDWSGSSNTEHTERGSGSYFEIGAGAFKAMDVKGKWVGEIYSGLGAGSVKNEYGYNDFSKVNSFKFFIQPAMGYKGKYFEAVVIPKLSFINWNVKEKTIGNSNSSSAGEDLSAISAKKSFVAFEPAFLLRGGGEGFKVQLALSFSNYRSTSILYSADLIETLNASIGFSINLKPSQK